MITNGTNIGVNIVIAAFGTAMIAPIQLDNSTNLLPSSTIDYKVLNTNSWEDVISLTENPEKISFDTLSDFSQNLIQNTKDIEPEILELVNDKFWDLL
ncbi:MAG: hypothetical protein MI975_24885 [Cytophagales bacterium]|nr:hypothetical protein [Cytophagales bacterium]